ncbi:hypothetical protein P7C70_g7038, partial [Phenoliferia sp. Uapishka_3]
MVAFMLDEPPHPHFPNDANATANAYRTQHEAHAAYAAANIRRFEELAGFTSHVFLHNNVTTHNQFAFFDSVRDFNAAGEQGALRVTIEERDVDLDGEDFDWNEGLEEDGWEEGSEEETEMELNGLAEGFTLPKVEDFPNPDRPFFHSRMGGYVVIPTDKYDELLDAQHRGLEAERLAADTIKTLEQ